MPSTPASTSGGAPAGPSAKPSLRERFDALRNLRPFLKQIWATSPTLTLLTHGLVQACESWLPGYPPFDPWPRQVPRGQKSKHGTRERPEEDVQGSPHQPKYRTPEQRQRRPRDKSNCCHCVAQHEHRRPPGAEPIHPPGEFRKLARQGAPENEERHQHGDGN